MKAQTMRQLRKIHHYVGVFFAPAILFFAFSGAVQTFRLGEESGWGAKPPAILVWVTSVHKDQTLPHAKPAKPVAAAASQAKGDKPDGDHDADHHDDHLAKRGPSPLPLKIFVVLLATGLIVSALLGVTIALNAASTRRISLGMLAAGTLVPLLLLYL
jgi:hypothetical protein